MEAPIGTGRPVLCEWSRGQLIETLRPGETRVLVVDLAALGPDEEHERLPEWPLLVEEERHRACRFVRPRDRRRFILCRGALRQILGALLEVPPRTVAFRSGPGGKPELVPPGDGPRRDDPPPLRFNVTHSGELALIALDRDREIGVDIEVLRSIPEAERIVASYFTPAEQVAFSRIEPGQKPAAFLRGWTRKEAILKAKGVGLAGLATEFETHFGDRDLDGEFRPAWPMPEVLGWSLWEAVPRPGYAGAIAVALGPAGQESP